MNAILAGQLGRDGLPVSIVGAFYTTSEALAAVASDHAAVA